MMLLSTIRKLMANKKAIILMMMKMKVVFYKSSQLIKSFKEMKIVVFLQLFQETSSKIIVTFHVFILNFIYLVN